MNPITRRDLLKSAALTGALLSLPETSFAEDAVKTTPPSGKGGKTMMGVPFEPRERVKAAFIGVGGRGSYLLREFLATDGVDVKAICDVVPEKVRRSQKDVTDFGQPEPRGYSNGDRDYENLLQNEEIDIAVIATPWEWHVPMSLYAMNHGTHAFTEVPACYTIEDCWKLVNTSEKTRRHCVMMENCCYGHEEMLVNNMVHAGLFGALSHGEAAYIHDLRDELFSNVGEGTWRRFHSMKRNGNLYPTHGLGPVAWYMDIHKGDRFESLVSMSSPSHGLQDYAARTFPEGDPRRAEKFVCGDVSTSIIRTALGRTILLQRDTNSPRVYDRLNAITGTRGMFRGYPARLYLDSFERDEYTDLSDYRKYESPMWTNIGELARKRGGHGGMDFIMAYRFVQCVREGLPPDMDVYDAAAWSAPTPLSEMSVKKGGAPQPFPDFTRGMWRIKN